MTKTGGVRGQKSTHSRSRAMLDVAVRIREVTDTQDITHTNRDQGNVLAGKPSVQNQDPARVS